MLKEKVQKVQSSSWIFEELHEFSQASPVFLWKQHYLRKYGASFYSKQQAITTRNPENWKICEEFKAAECVNQGKKEKHGTDYYKNWKMNIWNVGGPRERSQNAEIVIWNRGYVVI